MTFQWPHLFWLLLAPAVLVVWDLRRKRAAAASARPKIVRAEAATGHLALLHPSATPKTGPRVRWRLALGLTFAALALTRPQWGRLEEPVFDQSREILIGIDLSRSMLAPDVKPSRLERGKLLITSLLERLAGERVGLVVFAGTSFLQVPLSADYEILREFLPPLGPDYLPEGGSNYTALLKTALEAFGATAGADRFLIVLSDGEATDDGWKNEAAKLREKGIRVIGLGIGTSEGAMLPDGSGGFVKDDRGAVVLSRINSSTLQELASSTGGVYVDASAWVDIAQLIKTTVENGRKGEFREASRIRLAERFQWALAPALLFLVWSFWREFPVRPKARDIALARTPAAAPTPARSGPPNLPAVERAGRATAALALATFLFTHLLAPPAARAQVKITPPPAPSALTPKAAPAPTQPKSPGAVPPPQTTDPLAQPLARLVGQLSTRDTLQASDFAEMAHTTITYGNRLKGAHQMPPENAIHDALAAVDAGAALDPKAEDWPALRTLLEDFLKKPEKPEDQQNEDKDQKGDPDQSGDKNQKGGKDKQKEDPSKKDQDQEKKEQDQSQQDPSKPEDSQDQQDGEKKENQPDQADQKAFDDMNKPDPQPPAEPPPPEPGEMQDVGGSPEKNKNGDPKELDPALALPLQKLDQLRGMDSPAKLHQLMQGEKKSGPAQKGKDW